MTGNDADGADATQEALIRIVANLDRFDGRSRFGTWAYRVGLNACLDELRKRSRRPVPADGADLRSLEDAGTTRLDDEVATRVDVDRALLRLSPEFRAAVVLRDLCGLDYAEIGDILTIPPGTVRSRIARGRAEVGHFLGNPGRPQHRPTAQP